jgi:hypothetical protein
LVEKGGFTLLVARRYFPKYLQMQEKPLSLPLDMDDFWEGLSDGLPQAQRNLLAGKRSV